MSDDLRTVATFASPAEAGIVRNALEAAGIRAVIQDEYTLTMDPLLHGAVGFIKVQVCEADLARAVEVLSAAAEPEKTAAEIDVEPAADGESDEYPPESEGERLVRYAYRAAVMGLLGCPPLLHLYSLVLLVRVALFHSDLPPAANRRFYVAFLLDLAVVGTAALLVVGAMRY